MDDSNGWVLRVCLAISSETMFALNEKSSKVFKPNKKSKLPLFAMLNDVQIFFTGFSQALIIANE